MNILAVKIDLVQKLLTIKNELRLDKISELLSNERIVGYTVKGEPLTEASYNKRLGNAEAEIVQGNSISQEDLEQETKSWK